ncbi:MAG TPA: hypothetical protein VGM94_18815 [Galbitalea sp.]
MSPNPPTPTSTDRRFRRGLIAVIVALVVVAGSLGAVSVLQGPKIEGSQLNPAALAAGPGQQLRLIANQAIAPVSDRQVSVFPPATVTAQSQGDVIIIRFGGALNYATEYTVTVKGVTSSRGGAAATLRQTFRTPAFSFDYLVRGADDDKIVKATVGTVKRTVVYEAPHIEDFVPIAGALVLVSDADGGGNQIDIVQPGQPQAETLALPDVGTVNAITAVGTTILFTLTSLTANPVPKYNENLFKVDLTANHLPTAVLGIDKQPLHVNAWRAIPGTTSVLLDDIGDVLRYDPTATTPPTFVASYPDLGGLSPDAALLGVTNPSGPYVLDLATAKTVFVPGSPIKGAASTFVEDVLPLTTKLTLERVAVPAKRDFKVVIASDDGTTGKILYQPQGDNPGILSYTATSNGRYLIVESIPDTTNPVSDGAVTNPRPKSVIIDVIELDSGLVDTEVAGFDPRW